VPGAHHHAGWPANPSAPSGIVCSLRAFVPWSTLLSRLPRRYRGPQTPDQGRRFDWNFRSFRPFLLTIPALLW
jgi:hypothetical protein